MLYKIEGKVQAYELTVSNDELDVRDNDSASSGGCQGKDT